MGINPVFALYLSGNYLVAMTSSI